MFPTASHPKWVPSAPNHRPNWAFGIEKVASEPGHSNVLTPPLVGWYGVIVKPQHKTSALNRLKTVRGHLNAVIDMVEDEKYCPDVMKQVSALQASLEKVNRVLLQNHLETCVTHAVAEGRTAEIVDELLETMKYTAAVTGPGPIELETL
jgi:DNA-binding FrmR family transcriptional regulator